MRPECVHVGKPPTKHIQHLILAQKTRRDTRAHSQGGSSKGHLLPHIRKETRKKSGMWVRPLWKKATHLCTRNNCLLHEKPPPSAYTQPHWAPPYSELTPLRPTSWLATYHAFSWGAPSSPRLPRPCSDHNFLTSAHRL